MKKIIITTSCDPRESWGEVLAQTAPRFEKYAARHGYDFKEIWYQDIDHARFPAFKNPGPFVEGAVNYERRQDFIRWRLDRSMLAPNWLRYAAVIQLLDEYDLVMYLDGDVVIADFETDVAAGIPLDKWLAAPINGPSPDNAGPGGPMFITRSHTAAKVFWWNVWRGRKWIDHPAWTDGVDFMDLLGYTISEPVHKIRNTEYDASFREIPRWWIQWGPQYNASAKFYHAAGSGGSGNVAAKLPIIRQIIERTGV